MTLTTPITVEALNEMDMTARLDWLTELRSTAGVRGLANLTGVLRFFAEHELGAPGTWISWVNAGILESVMIGLVYRIQGIPLTIDESVPGVGLWLIHYANVTSGTSPEQQKRSFSRAKELADEYGLVVAAGQKVHPTPSERRYLALTQISNWTLRNPVARDILIDYAQTSNPSFAAAARTYLVDSFDNVELTREACSFTWMLAHLPPSSNLGTGGMQ